MRVKKGINFCRTFSMKANLIEFNWEKYNLNYKSHIYKSKTMTYTSTNTHLKVFIRFQIINRYAHKFHVLDKSKEEKVTICDY